MGQADLHPALLEHFVERPALGVERVHGERPERGRRRDRPALLHRLGEHRRRAAERLGLALGRGRGAGAPSPSAARTSDLVILPPGPVPLTDFRLTPFASAARRASGVARAPSSTAASCSVSRVALAAPSHRRGGGRGASAPASADAAGAPPSPLGAPLVISASGLPTSIVSSGPTRTFVIVPEAGAGTSASTLSVDTSTTVSPSSTESPSETCHSSTVPSVTDSPISGITISRPPPSSDLPADTEASSVVAFTSSPSADGASSNISRVAPRFARGALASSAPFEASADSACAGASRPLLGGRPGAVRIDLRERLADLDVLVNLDEDLADGP